MDLEILQDRIALEAVCRRHHVQSLEVFGSAARGVDFNPDSSDIDILVTFAPATDLRLKTWTDLRDDLQSVFQRPVDLLNRSDIERSPNYIRRKSILNEARTLYVAPSGP